MNVGDIERKTQERVIDLLISLGYEYKGDFQDRDNNNIEDSWLKAFLKRRGHSDEIILKAIHSIHSVAENQTKNLYEINQEIYSLMRYGTPENDVRSSHKKTIHFIDWDNPLDNDFAVAEEVTIIGTNTKRPDVVLYINGIAVGVLELKRSTVSVSNGIRQNITNQHDFFIKPFFSTLQFIMAGNDTEGLRFGVIGTAEKHYLTWKEDKQAMDDVSIRIRDEISKHDIQLDKSIISTLSKERIIEIIHDFIVFDKGIKKICRPNQFFGVKAAKSYVKRHEGGIVWHTQGSGKSLTMVWLTKWILETLPNSRVLIMTDREELDDQIEKVYQGVNENIYRTKSGRDLISKIGDTRPRLICSLIHKFGRREESINNRDYEKYIDELQRSLPSNFNPKGDFFVFVDECHRTQSGKLHQAMKTILNDAVFYGFTGTPLMKQDKQSSLETFGPYIHRYKFDEAVKDKVVLDLRYESRYVDQNITSQGRIDQWFDVKTRGLNDVARARLKQKWGTMQNVFSSKSRLLQIAKDICLDFETKERLQNGRGNAILVAGSIYQACKYYEVFQDLGFKKCAVITSYDPKIGDIRTEVVGEDGETDNYEKYEIYQKMLAGKKVEDFEKEVKELFIKHPAQMKLLIVVDKLLTGFDAPPATYLYIDKSMQDHGLFQAICRVNRIDSEDKEFGYIIDYKDLFCSLEKAYHDYTVEAFDCFDKEDIDGLLSHRLEKAKDRLNELLDALRSLCEYVSEPKGSLEFIHFFCGENLEDLDELKNNESKREELYRLTSSSIRAFSDIANEMWDAGYSSEEAKLIRKEIDMYSCIRDEIKLASGDYIDLKAYEPDMRFLIDNYIRADETQYRSTLDDFSLIELLVERGEKAIDELPPNIKNNKEAIAETIENNVRYKIIEKSYSNPRYFHRMSALLTDLILRRRQEAISYEEYLREIVNLTHRIHAPENTFSYPDSIKPSSAKRALYDNLSDDENLTNNIHEAIISSKQEGFRSNAIKGRRICAAIAPLLGGNRIKVEEIFKIICEQEEY